MNMHLYRIIFNRARGLFMAVAEIASACGKNAGDTRPGATPAVRTPAFACATLRTVAFATLLALGAQLAVVPLASAQIVAYRAAPASQRPTVLSAGNGVPLINIQTPSAAGVSRNTYEQFDVQTPGAILNNSRTNVSTQLAGWVPGNPWLATGSARVILNEVVSANPSQLLGFIEVAGSAAQVVITNPAGITCDGCGFINASRATLTTGTPIVSGGNLDGYRVEGGTIRIDGAGMDASGAGYTDLIARAVEVNAGLWAQTLKVTAGANVVDAGNSSVTPIAGSGPAPAFAIDVASLGGMYAGKITLVGTEAGVGVRNAGHLGASAGEVIVTVDGRLTNSGEIVADGDLAIAAASLENRNLINGRDTRIDIAGTLDNLGAARLYGDHLAIAAGTLNNHADGGNTPTIAARSRLDLGVGTLSNRTDALIVSADDLSSRIVARIVSAGDLAIGGALDGTNRATGSAGTINNASATIEALGSLSLNANLIDNSNEHFSATLATVSSEGVDEYIYGGRYRPDQVSLTWTQTGGVYYPPATDGMSYMSGQGFFSDNSNNYVYLNSPSGSTRNFWLYSYTRTTQETQVLTSVPGWITAGGDLQLTAATLKNDNSKIIAGGNLLATLGTLDNTATAGERIVRDAGTAWYVYRDSDHHDSDRDAYGYNPAPTVTSFDLGAAAWSAGTPPPASAAPRLPPPTASTAPPSAPRPCTKPTRSSPATGNGSVPTTCCSSSPPTRPRPRSVWGTASTNSACSENRSPASPGGASSPATKAMKTNTGP